jgi:hypothetical protein
MTSVLIQGDQGLAVRRFRCAADGRRAQANIESDGIGATLLRRVCGWCQAEMGVVAGSPDQAGEITHGICPACAERMTNELPGTPRLSCAVGSATAGRDRHNLALGGGLEDGGRDSSVLGAPAVDAALLAPFPSPATPGADIVAAGRAQGTLPGQVNGTAAPASPAAALEHLSGGPAAVSAPPRGLFWTVTGRDFGRVIRWAKNHWRNPLDALVRGKIEEIKQGRES